MNNFRFYAPTDIRFGKGQADCLPEELGKYGKRILMVYGGGSVKRSGLYDRLQELLKEFEIFELPGIEPNPKITSVRKGVEICKKEQIDVPVSAREYTAEELTQGFEDAGSRLEKLILKANKSLEEGRRELDLIAERLGEGIGVCWRLAQ